MQHARDKILTNVKLKGNLHAKCLKQTFTFSKTFETTD